MVATVQLPSALPVPRGTSGPTLDATRLRNEWRLLRLLCGGAWHSGTALAAQLHISRGALSGSIAALRGHGLESLAPAGRGYRLAAPVELLSGKHIRRVLSPEGRRLLRRLEVYYLLASTSDYIGAMDADEAHRTVVLAEGQTHGRGRNANTWTSPLTGGLYLSLGWRYVQCPPSIGILSMAAAVTLVETLGGFGIHDVHLKWPNDLLHRDRKIGGILVDSRIAADGSCRVVLGVGLNVALPRPAAQPWTDLAAVTGGRAPGRNLLASRLIDALAHMLQGFPRLDRQALLAAWGRHDCIAGRAVVLRCGERSFSGRAVGIHADGSLRLQVNGQVKRFPAGEIHLRVVT